MLEWLKRHAWKACNRQNRFAGSNPVLSASFISVQLSPRRRRAVFLYSVFLLSHTSGGGCDNAKLIARCPYRRLRLSLPSLFLTKTPRFHLFTFSPFHLFTLSISRYDAIALYLAADGNNLTAVAVAAWTAGPFSLLSWNLDNLARCALQSLTLQSPVIGIGVRAGGYIDRITPSHCRLGCEDKEE